jgi:hypothetical protein
MIGLTGKELVSFHRTSHFYSSLPRNSGIGQRYLKPKRLISSHLKVSVRKQATELIIYRESWHTLYAVSVRKQATELITIRAKEQEGKEEEGKLKERKQKELPYGSNLTRQNAF